MDDSSGSFLQQSIPQSGKLVVPLMSVVETGREETTASKSSQEHRDVRPKMGRARSSTGPLPLAERMSKRSDAVSGMSLETNGISIRAFPCDYQQV